MYYLAVIWRKLPSSTESGFTYYIGQPRKNFFFSDSELEIGTDNNFWNKKGIRLCNKKLGLQAKRILYIYSILQQLNEDFP